MKMIKNLEIYIYLIITLIILIPFMMGNYLYSIDYIPDVSIYRYLDSFYGKIIPEYGGFSYFKIISFSISEEIFQKLIFFSILFLSGYSTHLLVKKMTSSIMIPFYAGVLYMLNPYTYTRILAGHWHILFSYAIVPFLLKTFIDLIEIKEKKEMVRFVLLLSIVAFNIHTLIISLFIISIIFLCGFYKHKDIRILRIIIISAILFIFLNSYWIIPVITTKNTVADNISDKDFELFAPKGGLFDIAAMYGFWREGYLYAKDFLPGWQILYLIILSLTILGFISYYKDDKIGIYVKAFAVIGIVGFILASGVNGPLGDIVRWLFDNTILKGFRDSHKFVAMMVLAYSVLGGLGLNKIKSVLHE